MSEPRLKCPFCASTNNTIDHLGDDERPFFAVVCRNCEAEGPIAQNRDAAITAWNTRRKHDGDGA